MKRERLLELAGIEFDFGKSPEQQNPKDVISVDVPLMIRLLEWAREDAKTDMELHKVADNLIALSANGKPLCMQDYDAILKGVMTGEKVPTEKPAAMPDEDYKKDNMVKTAMPDLK